MMFIPLPLFAFGIGGLFTIMMSMTADICDLDELQTGERREGTLARSTGGWLSSAPLSLAQGQALF